MKIILGFAFIATVATPLKTKFSGKYDHSDKCSHLFEEEHDYNAYITPENSVCCMCTKGTYWDGDCNESSPETTECISCVHTENRRTYVDYEPHNRKECFLEKLCPIPRRPVGGSTTKQSSCECPPGMKPNGEYQCEPYSDVSIANSDSSEHPATPYTTNTDDEPDLSKMKTLPFDAQNNQYTENTEGFSDSKIGDISPGEVAGIVLGALVLLIVIIGALWIMKMIHSQGPGENARESPESGDPRQISKSKEIITKFYRRVTNINEEPQKTNKAEPFTHSLNVPLRNSRGERVEQQPLMQENGARIPQCDRHQPQQCRNVRRISEQEKKLVRDAVLNISVEIEKKDLNQICHHLPIHKTEIKDMKDEHKYDNVELATQIFQRYLQQCPQTSLQTLRQLVKYPYLTAIVDDKLQELHNEHRQNGI